tara:strand:+ start:445 stop:636 length:192 start_codon:yes stop_codon:yes gene_type:complete
MYGIAWGNGVLSYVSQWATLIVDGGDSRGLNVTTLMTMMIEIFNFFFIKTFLLFHHDENITSS